MKHLSKWWQATLIAVILLLIGAVALWLPWDPARRAGENLLQFGGPMLLLLPPVFVLIGLFEAWVRREDVERHLGRDAGWRGIVWAVLLGSMTIGPMIVALPISYAIFKKGASLPVVFVYLGAASVCRIPMTILEATLLGVPFTLVRYGVALPLLVIAGLLMGKALERRQYQIRGE